MMNRADTAEALTLLPPFAAAPECERDGGERELVRRIKAGDDDAFRLLVERHQEAVYQFCYQWLREVEDARDATQETFIRAYRAFSGYEHESRVLTWLYRIALNLCRDRIRARNTLKRWGGKRAASLDAIRQDAVCPAPQPDSSAAWNNDLARLGRGLEALPRRFREILVLRCIEGLSQHECAAVLGCSIRAVEGRLRRARKALLDWWDTGS